MRKHCNIIYTLQTNPFKRGVFYDKGAYILKCTFLGFLYLVTITIMHDMLYFYMSN